MVLTEYNKVVSIRRKQFRRMGGPSRTETSSSTGREDGPEMPRHESQNDDEDLEGQVVDGNRMTSISPTKDKQASTVEEATLQVDAYVVGQPSWEQRRIPAKAQPIEATVLQNETQVDARIWWFVRGLVVIAVALAITLPLTLRDKNNAELETLSPTIAPELKDPWLILQPIIGTELKDGSYVQEAYNWLTMEDQSGILDDPYTPEWRIVQRFVLANFYFATNGTAWSNQLRFLSKDNECTWKETIPYNDWMYDLWIGYSTDANNVTSLPAGVIQCDIEGRVESLRIAQNGLQNTIPSVLRYLSDLKELGLETNPFGASPMPSWLADLARLKVLDFTRCSLSGTIPTALPGELRMLVIYDNLLTGTLPSEIGHLSMLEYIHAGMNELTGPLPHTWNRLSHLEEIWLNDNHLVGTLPESWSQWISLSKLFLFRNALTGTLPDAWNQLSLLEEISLGANHLVGTLPKSWSQWTALAEIELCQNALTGTLPKSWSEWTNVEGVFLYESKLTGTLPDSWSEWPNVKFVYLFENNLTGTLPESWSHWTTLIDLGLGQNALTGTLPDAWGEWSNVELVEPYDNYLTGTLPESWSQWSALWDLSLDGNMFTGTLPNGWRQLTSLEYVWLDDNYLTGTLPSSYASWKTILEAYFSVNCLEETIPLEYELEWTFLEMNFSDVFGIQREDCRVGNQTST